MEARGPIRSHPESRTPRYPSVGPSPAMTPLSASTGGRFDGRVASFDLASTSSNMGSIYGDDAHDEVSVDSMDTSRLRAASPAPKSERRWKLAPFEDVTKNFKVVIRVRPPLPRELSGEQPFRNVVKVDPTERQITVSENPAAIEDDSAAAATAGLYQIHTFTFDHVYDIHCNQKKVYETTAKTVVDSSLQGYNATIFAYGQTGTGKTYTMEGFNSQEERGIIPRAIEQIFNHIQMTVSPRMRFLVRASYLQIYNEVISDLLKPERTNLVIREDKKRGVFVEGLSEWVVRSPAEIYGLMERGGTMRATGSTKMNEMSSRSHAVFIIIAEQSETTYLDESGKEMSAEDFHKLVKSRAHGDAGQKLLEANVRQSFKVGKLNLVDLAGSERVRLTGATGQRLEETKKINQSLSALGNVIAALTDPRGRQHIPYRDSKLTRILEDSLGGNCKTTMMAMISPALEAFVESLSTLKFANRAKNIKNIASINEDLDQKSLLRRYERELKNLRAQLDERSRSVVDSRRLLELDEQRRRAEEDKMAAIRALEARSREFMREKAEKRALEERIASLQSQIVTGGQTNVKDSPAFRNAVKEHQERVRQEYEARLADLERERESVVEEKAQVDRYKQLLLKQRDIMILLTQRLNERDEQIVALQDELDAYDRHQKELEDKLDEKTTLLIHLQRVSMEKDSTSPVKAADVREALANLATEMGKSEREDAASGGVTGAVSKHMLITTPQYRPYDAPVVFSGATGAGNGGGGLLSAEDKITELQRVVDAAVAEREHMARELEEVQAEKVSMEYLLREKLEKLVQSQIEARMASYRKDAKLLDPKAVAALKDDLESRSRELASLKAEDIRKDAEIVRLRRASGVPDTSVASDGRLREFAERLEEKNALVLKLQQENERLRKEGGGSSHWPSDDSGALREQLALHEKERRAIQTIMENKIKALTDAIAAVVQLDVDPTTPSGAKNLQRLSREVQALQRLVNASVSALRNSETEKMKSGNAPGSNGSNASVVPSAPLAVPPPAAPPTSQRSVTPLPTRRPSVPSVGQHEAAVNAMISARKEEIQVARSRSASIR